MCHEPRMILHFVTSAAHEDPERCHTFRRCALWFSSTIMPTASGAWGLIVIRLNDRVAAILLWSVIAAAVTILALALPPRSFFSGDSGVKLIVARNAIQHPARPLDVDLPRIDGQVAPFVDPFFVVHGDHSHAVTSDLFPVLAAPFIALLGIRGALVLPVAGFLATIWFTAALGVALDHRRSRVWLIFVAVACTPLFFYGLEFWEHAPAAAVAAVATTLYVKHRSPGMLAVSGALLGLAVLLRPEAVCYAVALAVGSRWLRGRFIASEMAVVGAGALLMFLPFAALSAWTSGRLLGTIVSSDSCALLSAWWANRWAYLGVWLLPPSNAWLAAFVVLAAAAVFASAVEDAHRKAIVRLAGVTFAAVIAFASSMGTFGRPSIWNAAPAVFAAFAAPLPHERRGGAFLWVVAGLSFALVTLIAPGDGGAQWGPRYATLSFIPLAILIGDAFAATMSGSRVVGTVAVAAALVLSLAVQRHAYRDLSGSKKMYERIVEFVERETPDGSVIVTDVWWFDQVTAGLYPTRHVLVADTTESAARVSRMLAATPRVYLVRSDTASSGEFPVRCDGMGLNPTRRARVGNPSLELVECSRTK